MVFFNTKEEVAMLTRVLVKMQTALTEMQYDAAVQEQGKFNVEEDTGLSHNAVLRVYYVQPITIVQRCRGWYFFGWEDFTENLPQLVHSQYLSP